MRVSLRDVMAGTFSVITKVITLPMVVHVNPHAGGSGVVLGAVGVADAQPGEDLPLQRLHAVGFACVLVVPAEQVQGAVDGEVGVVVVEPLRSEEHTSELQSLMRISYADFCLN